jgi:hypothetical protein
MEFNLNHETYQGPSDNSGGIIRSCYFFCQPVSAIYDPIKIYKFSLTREELENEISRVMKDDSSLTHKLTDSTGTDQNDLNYYLTLIFKREGIEATFRIKYLRSHPFFGNAQSEIDLIGAFDKTTKAAEEYHMRD